MLGTVANLIQSILKNQLVVGLLSYLLITERTIFDPSDFCHQIPVMVWISQRFLHNLLIRPNKTNRTNPVLTKDSVQFFAEFIEFNYRF